MCGPMALCVVRDSIHAPSHSEITSPDEKHMLYVEMCKLWGLDPRSKDTYYNPCCTPVSADAEAIDTIVSAADDYVVGLKLDGTRYLLMLTTDYTNPTSPESVAIMIDRNMRMFEVPVYAMSAFYSKGVLLDGELVTHANGENEYCVFDAMNVEGRNVCSEPYTERLRLVYSLLSLRPGGSGELPRDAYESVDVSWVADERKIVAAQDYPPLSLSPKRAVGLAHIEQLYMGSGASACTDGYIFTKISARVQTGRAKQLGIVKWKPVDKHTVDVCVSADGTVLCSDVECGARVPLPPVDVLGAVCGFKLHPTRTLSADGAGDSRVFECAISPERGQDGSILLILLRIRPDKAGPNTMPTIHATVVQTTEQITASQVVAKCLACGK